MKDLDFDELDRAVNSLIGNGDAPVAGDGPVAPTSQTDINPILSQPSTEPVTDKPVSALPLATRRSSGRFMDVVHPSSDMRSTSVSDRPASRVGTTIPSPMTTPGAYSRPLVVPDVTTTSSSADEPEKPSQWPDPIDFHGFEDARPDSDSVSANVALPSTFDSSTRSVDEAISTSPEVDEDSDITKLADDINATLNGDPETPLNSPFLADAKVEKRPLGAFSFGEVAPATAATLAVVAPQDSSPAASSVEEKSIDTPMPAELQDDLLLLESDNVESPTPEIVAPVETPVGPTSITQQYKEQPSTSDQPTGAIFDTHAYQKPLAHPAKKKSGWVWVFWIALLIIAGAGAGAVVYFFVLPLL